jgi:leucyl-tRNA synthetase
MMAMPVLPMESLPDPITELGRELAREIRAFMKTLKRFEELRERLAEMLDDAIASGKVQVKTAKDIQTLVDAYSKLAETESKLATAMAQLMKVANERDALTVAVFSRTDSGKVIQAEFNPKALIPVIGVSEVNDESSE